MAHAELPNHSRLVFQSSQKRVCAESFGIGVAKLSAVDLTHPQSAGGEPCGSICTARIVRVVSQHLRKHPPPPYSSRSRKSVHGAPWAMARLSRIRWRRPWPTAEGIAVRAVAMP